MQALNIHEIKACHAYKSHISVATATALPPELPPGTSHTSSQHLSSVLLAGGNKWLLHGPK